MKTLLPSKRAEKNRKNEYLRPGFLCAIAYVIYRRFTKSTHKIIMVANNREPNIMNKCFFSPIFRFSFFFFHDFVFLFLCSVHILTNIYFLVGRRFCRPNWWSFRRFIIALIARCSVCIDCTQNGLLIPRMKAMPTHRPFYILIPICLVAHIAEKYFYKMKDQTQPNQNSKRIEGRLTEKKEVQKSTIHAHRTYHRQKHNCTKSNLFWIQNVWR